MSNDQTLPASVAPAGAPQPRATSLSDAHVWELERLLTKLRVEDAGNFPLIQAIEAAVQSAPYGAHSPKGHYYGSPLDVHVAERLDELSKRILAGNPTDMIGRELAHGIQQLLAEVERLAGRLAR